MEAHVDRDGRESTVERGLARRVREAFREGLHLAILRRTARLSAIAPLASRPLVELQPPQTIDRTNPSVRAALLLARQHASLVGASSQSTLRARSRQRLRKIGSYSHPAPSDDHLSLTAAFALPSCPRYRSQGYI